MHPRDLPPRAKQTPQSSATCKVDLDCHNLTRALPTKHPRRARDLHFILRRRRFFYHHVEDVLFPPIGADKVYDRAQDKRYVGTKVLLDHLYNFVSTTRQRTKERSSLELRILISSFPSSRLSTLVLVQSNCENGGFHRRKRELPRHAVIK